MPLSWNEIKKRAVEFSKEWEDASSEKSEKQTFWNEFFNVFGIIRRRVAAYEKAIDRLGENRGYIDLFWPGTLVVEHKSKGQNLEKAFNQSLDYTINLKDYELPKYIIVSDFQRIRLFDIEENSDVEFELRNLHKNIHLFDFIAGYKKKTYKEEDPANIEAAELMGRLHDKLFESGYSGHNLEVFLVRILFCLFADDTNIFNKNIFTDLIELKTREDGSDIGMLLANLFQVLNTPQENRLTTLDEDLAQFPYVNGNLFAENLPIASFNSEMRQSLLRCCNFNWSKISPAVFGSLFQSVMDKEKRRNLGAHYTTEKNILKLIKPLFLDELQNELESCKSNETKLKAFHDKLSKLKFLDPACGCGNFLVITYREIRLLEIEVLKKLIKSTDHFFDLNFYAKLDVDQMYGIEYEEFPARIAEVAMWLVDHQMNILLSETFGGLLIRLPLKKSANIINGNALRIDWENIVKKEELSYILGNPPFVGKAFQTDEQNRDMELVFYNKNSNGTGVLDYVSGWYIKAAEYIKDTKIKAAFVSTNSITQGEQVGILWNILLNYYGIKIHFAHRTFKWSSEAKGKANVFVVIIGFANFDTSNKVIFEYEKPDSDPHEIKAKNINPYLVDGNDVVITTRKNPISDVPEMLKGSQPTDDGNLLLSDEDKIEFLLKEPQAKKFIHPFISAKEFLHNEKRWCFWLLDAKPDELKKCPNLIKRIQAVKDFRLKSKKKATIKWAEMPSLFTENRQPQSEYILIPRHTSENRKYIPFGFFDKEFIVADSCNSIPNASLFHFGVISSEMHMVWIKYICGRIKGDYRYSNDIVYNNFPWPEKASGAKKISVVQKAQKVLVVRNKFAESSLADLYDPLAMPPELTKAHHELDKAVDKCYRSLPFNNDNERIEFLFGLYNKYLNPLEVGKIEKIKNRTKKDNT